MNRTALSASAIALGLPLGALAQPADLLPPDPSVLPAPEREVSTEPAPGPTGPVKISENTTAPGLVLNGISLDGATALGIDRLKPIWADLIGSTVTVATLEDVAQRIGATYRAEGYILTQAILPEQTVENGIVGILVVEGFVNNVEITSDNAAQQRLAQRYFTPIPEDRPLRLSTLERGVLLSRDSFGASVETVLEPSPDTFGAANLGVLIEPQPTSWFTTLDNRGSRLYGTWTLSGGSRSYNLLGLNERIDSLVTIAPDNLSIAYGSATVEMPLAALSGTVLDGARMELSGNISRSDPDLTQSGTPEELTVTLDESNLRLGMTVPFIRTRSQNLFGRVGIGFRQSDSATDFDAETGTETTDETDRLVVLDMRATWDIADDFGGVTLLDAAIRKGLDVGGARIDYDGPDKPDVDFILATANLSRLQRIGTDGWALWAEMIGQYAADILPNSERFSLGNGTIGRGFAPGNTSGDSGFGLRVEVRKNLYDSAVKQHLEATQLYAFGDYGRARDRSEDRDGEQWETLASVGIGARIDIRPWLTLTPEIAHQVRGQANDTTDTGHETRFYIGAVARF